MQKSQDSLAAIKIPEIQFFLCALAFFNLASRALVVIIGYQIYKITGSALALGILGLIEAIPAISLSLFGGYAADRYNRRTILLITRCASIVCALLLAWISSHPQGANVYALYAVIFLAGIARGFADPANSAFEAQVVPKHLTVNASSWVGSILLTSSIIGPAVVGFVYDLLGITTTYMYIGVSFFLSWVFTMMIQSKPKPAMESHESVFESIKKGIDFVFKREVLIGAMALDLFAVLFGGMVALLPIFATDILHVGAKGLGLLQAATAFGSLLVMLYSTKHPPIAHAGRNLLLCVAGFGLSIILFAFSTSFILSLILLTFSGIFDGVSMVIRRSIMRLLSPDHMRGRVSAVGWIFIGASNELGAFESGFVAHLIGVIPCVWVGGVITLLVVAVTAIKAPKLRRLRFNPHTLDQHQTQ